MAITMDLSLFTSEGLDLENYLLLPKSMRSKLIKDLTYTTIPRFQDLKELQNHEENPALRSLIQQVLATQDQNSSRTNSSPIERRILKLLQVKDKTSQMKAFQYASRNPSPHYLPVMKSIVNKNRSSFLMACLAKVLGTIPVLSVHDLLILLKTPNPLVLKSVLESLEIQGSIEAREVFLSILRLPLAESSVKYQLCASVIHRIPVEIRSLCWAQAIASQESDIALGSSLSLFEADFSELQSLRSRSQIVKESKEVSQELIDRLNEVGERVCEEDLPQIRKLLRITHSINLLRLGIQNVAKLSSTNEWETLAPLLEHRDSTVRLEAGCALFSLKDKRIKPYFLSLLKNPDVPIGERLRWGEAGFFFLVHMEEKEAIQFLELLLDLGPNSVGCLTNCLKQWDSPSLSAIKSFLEALGNRIIKPFHRPAIKTFINQQKDGIRACKMQILAAQILNEGTSQSQGDLHQNSRAVRSPESSASLLENLLNKWESLLQWGRQLHHQISVAE